MTSAHFNLLAAAVALILFLAAGVIVAAMLLMRELSRSKTITEQTTRDLSELSAKLEKLTYPKEAESEERP